MQKLDGKICDNCRTMFYPNDKIVELCEKCANTVWCVFLLWMDGSEELCSIHHTEDGAKSWLKKQETFWKHSSDYKIVEQIVL